MKTDPNTRFDKLAVATFQGSNKLIFSGPLEIVIRAKRVLSQLDLDNNLNDSVKIINFLDNPYPIIKKSDIFILSSNFEGLPNVLLEAQTLKIPIISSNCPTGPKEILLNGKAGILFKLNSQKLCFIIYKLIVIWKKYLIKLLIYLIV